MRYRIIAVITLGVTLSGCGPDQAELQRRAQALGDPCDFLLAGEPRSAFRIATDVEIEQHAVPRADGSSHFGCVLTWTGREGSVVLGFDLYMFSGRGPQPGERVEQLLEKGEYRAAEHFAYEPISTVGERAAYNQQLNMLSWRHRGHLFYVNASDTRNTDRQALADFARELNDAWPTD